MILETVNLLQLFSNLFSKNSPIVRLRCTWCLRPNKSVGSDVPRIRFTKLSKVIATYLCKLFNKCVEYGVFTLKYAEVVPIHKSGKKSDVYNYRPICFLSSELTETGKKKWLIVLSF